MSYLRHIYKVNAIIKYVVYGLGKIDTSNPSSTQIINCKIYLIWFLYLIRSFLFFRYRVGIRLVSRKLFSITAEILNHNKSQCIKFSIDVFRHYDCNIVNSHSAHYQYKLEYSHVD